MVASEQISAARALLRLSVADLAKASGVGVATIKRIEAADGLPSANTRTLDALSRALQALGIEFIGGPNDAPGLRLHKSLQK